MFNNAEQQKFITTNFCTDEEIKKLDICQFINIFNALRPDLISIVDKIDRELKFGVPYQIKTSYYQKYIKYKKKYMDLKNNNVSK